MAQTETQDPMIRPFPMVAHRLSPLATPMNPFEELDALDYLRALVNRAEEVPAADVWRLVERYRAEVFYLQSALRVIDNPVSRAALAGTWQNPMRP